MITIISPAKTFREPIETQFKVMDSLFFNQEVEVLLNKLQQFTKEELCTLMKMSDTLGEVNATRYQTFQEQHQMHALFAYDGEAYKGLDSVTLGEDALSFSENHLVILSGLYGMLMPNQAMRPYRLEMQTSLAMDEYKDLYAFWKSRLTTKMLTLLDQTKGDRVLLNLASKEYSKALDLKLIMKSYPVITVEFKEQKGDTFKVVGMYAKKARGKMVRFILENEVDEVEVLKHYQEDGYAFNKDLSSPLTWVFTR